jgi:hypothetical protein
MSSQPEDANERTVALSQHRIESAIAWWRNGAELVRREPHPRREAYEHAVARVLATLQSVPNIPLLIRAYFTITDERWQVLAEACDTGDISLSLVRGVVEDAAFRRRLDELIAASQQAGPFPHTPAPDR